MPWANLSTSLSPSPPPQKEDPDDGSRRVTFQRALSSKAGAIIHQMKELLRKTGMDSDVEVLCIGTYRSSINPPLPPSLPDVPS